MRCGACQADNPAQAKFCAQCGGALTEPGLAACRQCGAELRPGDRFCTRCGLANRADAPASGAERRERRQLSVLFCDLVDSVGLSQRLDPEDYGQLLSAYRRACGAALQRYGDVATRYVGDGMRAYFGYPQAHENDAERAARAALDILAAVTALRQPQPLQVRLGIATGEVVIGVGGEPEAFGETPNLAARLQQAAPPDAVLVSDATRRLLGGLFACVDVGSRRLKGLAAPQRLWRLTAAASADRFAATRSAAVPLVGRREQLALLERRWRQAAGGAGQVVLLAGEAGIGKSRCARTLHQRLRADATDHHWLYYHCSPFHRDSPLYPIITQIEADSGIGANDPPARKLAKLAGLRPRQVIGGAERVPLLAALLSIPNDGSYPPLNVSSQRQRELIFSALVERIRSLAEGKPLLIIFEDVHWIDPTSQELLELSVRAAARARVLLLVTCRPDYQPPWLDEPQVSLVRLNRLDQDDTAELVRRVADTQPGGLPAALAAELADKSEGVPLFAEELTRAVLQPQVKPDPQGAAATRTAGVPLPATLQDSLTARLDRLGPAKVVAQTAAVLGREFSAPQLAALTGLPETELDAALEQLVQADIARRRGSGRDASFRFRHTLLQEAAYNSLLRDRRRELHARAARLLEQRLCFAPLWRRQPELLARHFVAAGEPASAAAYWLQAGRRSAQRSANVEALRHFGQGLAAAAGLPDSPQRQQLERDLQTQMKTVLETLSV